MAAVQRNILSLPPRNDLFCIIFTLAGNPDGAARTHRSFRAAVCAINASLFNQLANRPNTLLGRIINAIPAAAAELTPAMKSAQLQQAKREAVDQVMRNRLFMESDQRWRALLHGRPIDGRRLSCDELNQLDHIHALRRAERLVNFIQRHANDRPTPLITEFLRTIEVLDVLKQAERLRTQPAINEWLQGRDRTLDERATLPREVQSDVEALFAQRDIDAFIEQFQRDRAHWRHDEFNGLYFQMLSFILDREDVEVFREVMRRFPEMQALDVLRLFSERGGPGIWKWNCLNAAAGERLGPPPLIIWEAMNAIPSMAPTILRTSVFDSIHDRNWDSLRRLLQHPRISEIAPYVGREFPPPFYTEMPREIFNRLREILGLPPVDSSQSGQSKDPD